MLILTTSIPALLHALVALRTPSLVAIMASMYRYISVLIGEFNAMRGGCVSQLDRQQPLATLGIGNMIAVYPHL